MKDYICKQDFALDAFDDDGRSLEETITIEAGEVFQRSDDRFRIVGGSDTIHLENDHAWIEITPDLLGQFFDEVRENADN